jgi:hypothetical protein
MRSRRWLSSRVVLAALLLSGGCAQPATVNTQDVIANAVGDDLNIVDADDDRADHIDEEAAELLDQANTSTGSTASELRNEAAADMVSAAQIRQQGRSAGDNVEDADETSAGLLNGQ